MSKLLKRINPEVSVYKDRRFDGDEQDWQRALRNSTTLYVGNLNFYTREEQIYEVFSKVGHVDRIVMGLDKQHKTPCGFAFIIYHSRRAAEGAVKYLNGTVLDERSIRVDHDWGFVEGRQWGRGMSGGQVRDEFRLDYDPGRGGFGKVVQSELAAQYNSPVGSLTPGPMMPGAKRQRMDSGFISAPRERTGYDRGAGGGYGPMGTDRRGSGGGGGGGRPVEDNPRFRERERRGHYSDDEEGR